MLPVGLALRRPNFYPRPPRGGRLDKQQAVTETKLISIHALREEGDVLFISSFVPLLLFLSTPSARRATVSPGSTSST